jgi:excisionase family DNA binding protein
VARFLHLSGRQIDRLMHEGLPFLRIGRRVLFNPEAVRAWVDSKSSVQTKGA